MWPIATNAPLDLDLLGLAGLGVSQPRPLELAVVAPTNSSATNGVLKSMLSNRPGALEHDLRGAELVAAVDDRRARSAKLETEDRVLHRRVAAADHDHVGVLEEGAVADAAGRRRRGRQLHLAGDAEPLRLRAHRQDHRARRGRRRRRPRPCGSPPSESSIRVASSVTKRVPKRSAWSRNCCIISGPMIPSGNPGSSRRRSCSGAGRPTGSPR